MRILLLTLSALTLLCCAPEEESALELADVPGHGPIAPAVMAPLGEPLPAASAEQLKTFERGRQVALRRFGRADGLGPAFNVTFCASCHEKPTTGGGAGLYRNFFIGGTRLSDGSFVPASSDGPAGGVVRMFTMADGPARPPVDDKMNVISQRNPIPFFGVGLLAEIEDAEILSRADPDDADGDGISGRANYDQGFVGRFGRKSQTVSIEGFIRGPLKNHLGITTDPLSEAQKAELPVDSSSRRTARLSRPLSALLPFAQASAPAAPLTDSDAVADPELGTADLFDLVSFAMLLAAPQVEEWTEETERGRRVFDRIGCWKCHSPRLEGPRGPLPVYSDLLLHDMGSDLADGLDQGVATGSEFRTQPLWGIAAVGPYLHDGRAGTLRVAILAHGGEAQAIRDEAEQLTEAEWSDLEGFLVSLGGRAVASPGLLPPETPVPEPGEYGGPTTALEGAQAARFEAGRAIFDRDHTLGQGVGSPRFNGDSCRACHFDPVIGGAGPRGVNVMRHGIINDAGEFVVPAPGTVLQKETALLSGHANRPEAQANVFEARQTPTLLGLGLVESITDAAILANADPDDTLVPDGISGKPSWTDGGRLGRFGWKAQVPSLAEFVRDAVTTELGMTLPWVEGLTFGRIQDNDDVADPEMSLEDADTLLFFLQQLGPPPRQPSPDAAEQVAQGEAIFSEVGCASCHVPALEGATGPVALYSDLLLHEILPEGALGIEEASATMREFRTAPLWGLSESPPYLHDGSADTIAQAIVAHAGEATATVEKYLALSDSDRAALLAFLMTL